MRAWFIFLIHLYEYLIFSPTFPDPGICLVMTESMVAMLQQAGPLSLVGPDAHQQQQQQIVSGGSGGGMIAEKSLLSVTIDSMFEFGKQLVVSSLGGESLVANGVSM